MLIKADLRAFLAKQYAADKITPKEIDAVIKQLEAYSAADLYESNKAVMKFYPDPLPIPVFDRRAQPCAATSMGSLDTSKTTPPPLPSKRSMGYSNSLGEGRAAIVASRTSRPSPTGSEHEWKSGRTASRESVWRVPGIGTPPSGEDCADIVLTRYRPNTRSSASVFRVNLPVAGRPLLLWKAMIAWCVLGPGLPSTVSV